MHIVIITVLANYYIRATKTQHVQCWEKTFRLYTTESNIITRTGLSVESMTIGQLSVRVVCRGRPLHDQKRTVQQTILTILLCIANLLQYLAQKNGYNHSEILVNAISPFRQFRSRRKVANRSSLSWRRRNRARRKPSTLPQIIVTLCPRQRPVMHPHTHPQ